MDYGYLDRNVRDVRRRIEEAKSLSGRDEPVTLMAAIKSAEVEEVLYLHRELGITCVGENRVQQLLERYEALRDAGIEIHFIGTLQTNKVKYIVDKVSMIHSLDSLKLAREINRLCVARGLTMDVLVEINSGEEENKSGLSPCEAEAFCLALGEFSALKLRGFMTMAPKCDKKDDYRKFFAQTYQLVLDIWTKKLHNIDRPIISMGMSGSFEEAVAEGANLVRVGRTLFVK